MASSDGWEIHKKISSETSAKTDKEFEETNLDTVGLDEECVKLFSQLELTSTGQPGPYPGASAAATHTTRTSKKFPDYPDSKEDIKVWAKKAKLVGHYYTQFEKDYSESTIEQTFDVIWALCQARKHEGFPTLQLMCRKTVRDHVSLCTRVKAVVLDKKVDPIEEELQKLKLELPDTLLTYLVDYFYPEDGWLGKNYEKFKELFKRIAEDLKQQSTSSHLSNQ